MLQALLSLSNLLHLLNNQLCQASSLQHWSTNMLKMIVIRYSSIWPNLILIVFRIKKKIIIIIVIIIIIIIISKNVTSIMQQCLWWRQRFWNMWILQKHKKQWTTATGCHNSKPRQTPSQIWTGTEPKTWLRPRRCALLTSNPPQL